MTVATAPLSGDIRVEWASRTSRITAVAGLVHDQAAHLGRAGHPRSGGVGVRRAGLQIAAYNDPSHD